MTDYFAGQIALDYDKDVAASFAPDVIAPTVRALTKLAAGGACLEFAIGTGRVALLLRAAGVTVDGIEYSADMIRELRKRPGGPQIHVVQGDMASVDMGKTYSLVFLVFNTIMNLTRQEAQVACFRNASRHLTQGGKFAVEVMVPDLRKYPPGGLAVPFDISAHHLGFDTYVVSEQKLTSHHVTINPDGSSHYNSLPFRYVWPAELDLMAQLAGMRLVSRHSDWSGALFDDTSRTHVSVWEKC